MPSARAKPTSIHSTTLSVPFRFRGVIECSSKNNATTIKKYGRTQELDAVGAPCIQWAPTLPWSECSVVIPLGLIEMLGNLRIDPRHSIQTDSNVYDHGPTMSVGRLDHRSARHWPPSIMDINISHRTRSPRVSTAQQTKRCRPEAAKYNSARSKAASVSRGRRRSLRLALTMLWPIRKLQ